MDLRDIISDGMSQNVTQINKLFFVGGKEKIFLLLEILLWLLHTQKKYVSLENIFSVFNLSFLCTCRSVKNYVFRESVK